LNIIIFWEISRNLSADNYQFQEFIKELKYAAGLVSKKKYNLGQYYDHMADFFKYADMIEDAEEHRVLADKWRTEKGENNEN
jgi:hypothetical protein